MIDSYLYKNYRIEVFKDRVTATKQTGETADSDYFAYVPTVYPDAEQRVKALIDAR